MKKITKIPAAYVLVAIVLIAMLGLAVWQIILPNTNPNKVMGILIGGGLLAGFISAIYEMSDSRTPFAAASIPVALMCFWVGLVVMGTCTYTAIASHSFDPAIPGIITLVVCWGFGILIAKD